MFLTKSRTMASRVERLGELLQRAGDPEAVSLARGLVTIENLRRFRNAFLHGACGIDEKDQIVLVGWKGIEPFSRVAMEGHVDTARDMLLVLNDGYMARFGEHPTLQIAAKAAPPPTE